MVNSEEFAKRLEKILDYYGLSATAFSEQIDFNRSTISHLLSGRNKPSLEFVMKVLDEFPEVELYWLLNGKGHFPAEEASQQKIITPQPSSGGKSKDAPDTPRKEPLTPLKEIDRIISDEEIERIVIFFKDGTFKAYR